jgi:hypothetical protein
MMSTNALATADRVDPKSNTASAKVTSTALLCGLLGSLMTSNVKYWFSTSLVPTAGRFAAMKSTRSNVNVSSTDPVGA